MTSVLARELVFVTGKGGVGKTTVAAALALAGARAPAAARSSCEVGGQARVPRGCSTARAGRPAPRSRSPTGCGARPSTRTRRSRSGPGARWAPARVVGVLRALERLRGLRRGRARRAGARDDGQGLGARRAASAGRAAPRRTTSSSSTRPATGHGLAHARARRARSPRSPASGRSRPGARRCADLLRDPAPLGHRGGRRRREMPVSETLELEGRAQRRARPRPRRRRRQRGRCPQRFAARRPGRSRAPLDGRRGRRPSLAACGRQHGARRGSRPSQLRRLRRERAAAPVVDAALRRRRAPAPPRRRAPRRALARRADGGGTAARRWRRAHRSRAGRAARRRRASRGARAPTARGARGAPSSRSSSRARGRADRLDHPPAGADQDALLGLGLDPDAARGRRSGRRAAARSPRRSTSTACGTSWKVRRRTCSRTSSASSTCSRLVGAVLGREEERPLGHAASRGARAAPPRPSPVRAETGKTSLAGSRAPRPRPATATVRARSSRSTLLTATTTGTPARARALGDEAVARADALLAVEHEQRGVGVGQLALDAPLHALGQRVARALDAGQVDEHELRVAARWRRRGSPAASSAACRRRSRPCGRRAR